MSNEKNWEALYAPTANINNVPSFLAHTLPITKVEISISARNLLNLDTFSKSDPQCIVYMKDSIAQNYFEIGRTEIITDNLNPDFVHKILLDYNFETVQYLKFELWDIDMNDHDFLGEVYTTLPEIVANKSRQFVRTITNKNYKKDCGKLILVVEELNNCKQLAKFKFKINCLKINSCFNFLIKPSSFLKFWRSNEDGSFSVVYTTKTKWYTKNPEFDEFELKVLKICNADLDRNIKVDVMNYSSSGNHELLGTVFFTLNQLVNGPHQKKFEIKNKNKKIIGELELLNFEMSDTYSFFDYLQGGMEMHFAVAIDFTSSNGPVDSSTSLHFIDTITGRPNSYEIALKSIGEIIQYYNSSHQFPGFAFGAIVPPKTVVSHRFPLNGNMEQPYCEGVDQLVYWYRQCITKVVLYGPTNFAPIIDYTADIASKNSNNKNYFVLLIITDGIICDMPQTIRSIIRSSSLPMSIIIVGVGNADFTAMDELDSDDQPLEMEGKKAVRDIVQFVSLNKYIRKDGSYIQSQGDLARDVLYEIPDQVESYMKLRGLKPGMVN